MFQEAFTAGNAEISPFSQNESNLFSKVGDILYFLKPVIMDTSGFLATARTGLFSSVFQCEFAEKSPPELLF